jgi:hypothetical protein
VGDRSQALHILDQRLVLPARGSITVSKILLPSWTWCSHRMISFCARCAMHSRTLARLASISAHARRAALPSCSKPMSTAIPPDNPLSQPLNFATSPVPKRNPLGEQRHIKTAAALIIGYVYCSWFTKMKTKNSYQGTRFSMERHSTETRITLLGSVLNMVFSCE